MDGFEKALKRKNEEISKLQSKISRVNAQKAVLKAEISADIIETQRYAKKRGAFLKGLLEKY